MKLSLLFGRRTALLLPGAVLAALSAQAQLHIDGGSFFIDAGATVAVFGGNVTSNVNITGTGRLLMIGNGSAQTLGMNGNNIPMLEIDNTNNINLTSAARIVNNLTWTNGYVNLGANNLVYSAGATNTNNTATKFAVTDGAGFVRREAMPSGSNPFIFPIGRAIGDYNPATITNQSGAARDMSVQVKSNTESAVVEGNNANGINRTWQIFGSAAGNAVVALTNKTADEGTLFNHNAAFVTRSTSLTNFTQGSPEASSGMQFTHDSSLFVPATADGTSYFTKTDDSLNSRNPTTLIAAKVMLQGPLPGSGPALMTNFTQSDPLFNSGYSQNRLPENDPYGNGARYADIANPGGVVGAVTDWVQVEIRQDAYPFAIISKASGLLQTDGDILNNNAEPLALPATTTGPVRISVSHRNHLNVVSNANFAGMADGTTTSYDFTTSVGQALNAGVAPQIFKNTKAAMWAGDINTDHYIDNTDISVVKSGNDASIADAYNVADLNMDGFTDNTDISLVKSNNDAGLFAPPAL